MLQELKGPELGSGLQDQHTNYKGDAETHYAEGQLAELDVVDMKGVGSHMHPDQEVNITYKHI